MSPSYDTSGMNESTTLAPATHQDRRSRCAICDGAVTHFDDALILGDVPVAYFRCPACGFIQTQQPTWLDRAYATAITDQDLGLVARNMEMADLTEAVVRLCLDPRGTFLDHGGGYGMLVRLMRDRGLDFRLHDPLCRNLFAGPARVHTPDERRWNLVTAFEVLEHLVDPAAVVQQLLECSDTLLVSTRLLPEPTPRVKAWDYFGPEHGQHISLFSLRSLQCLADRCGARLISNRLHVHIITRARVPDWRIRMAMGRWGRRLARRHRRIVRLPSLTGADASAIGTSGRASA